MKFRVSKNLSDLFNYALSFWLTTGSRINNNDMAGITYSIGCINRHVTLYILNHNVSLKP